ncbi:MAG: hypothetical protein ABR574_01795 [Cryomorphaceae bacterium]|nr:hypothetical protein [Flavobacteriales bacterium]
MWNSGIRLSVLVEIEKNFCSTFLVSQQGSCEKHNPVSDTAVEAQQDFTSPTPTLSKQEKQEILVIETNPD